MSSTSSSRTFAFRQMSIDLIKEFIIEYKNNSCLWKYKCKEYLSKEHKEMAYRKLEKICQKEHPTANREFVVRKINSLRGSFRREYRRFMLNKNHQSQLWFYHLISFVAEQELYIENDENDDSYSEKRELDDNVEEHEFLKWEQNDYDKNNLTDMPLTISHQLPPPEHAYIGDIDAFVHVNDVSNNVTINLVDDDEQLQQHCTSSPPLEVNIEHSNNNSYERKTKKRRHHFESYNSTNDDASIYVEPLLNDHITEDDQQQKPQQQQQQQLHNIPMINTPIANNHTYDEYSAYAITVSSKLRKMDTKQRLYAENEINNILFKGLLKQLKNPFDNTVTILCKNGTINNISNEEIKEEIK